MCSESGDCRRLGHAGEGVDREKLRATVQKRIDELKDAGDVKVGASSGGFGSSDITISVTAPTADALQEATDALTKDLKGRDGVGEVTDNLAASLPYIAVVVDRAKAAEHGLSEVAVGSIVSNTMRPEQLGTVEVDGKSTVGPITGVSTDPTYIDVSLRPGERFSQAVNSEYSAFVYPYEGRIEVGPDGSAQALNSHSAGVLTPGEKIEVTAGSEGARFLLLAGRPLGEPVVQYGPFVMNTRQEIEQAVRDFQSGALTRT